MKALAFNLPSLLADADCRNLGFVRLDWELEELDDLFAKYDQEKRHPRRRSQSFSLMSPIFEQEKRRRGAQKVRFDAKREIKNALKVGRATKRAQKESSNSAATSPTSTPPPSHSTASSSFGIRR